MFHLHNAVDAMRLLLLLCMFYLAGCATTLDWPYPDKKGEVTVEELSMIRQRFESGIDPTPVQTDATTAIDLALAARGGVDKRQAVLTPPKTQAKFVDSHTILVKVSFSRSIGYGENYLEQFHVVRRNWRGEWLHLTFFEQIVSTIRQ